MRHEGVSAVGSGPSGDRPGRGAGGVARPGREQRRLDDARADAQRWYERLGGQVMNLHGDDPAAQQALADAGERYNAAGGQLQQAKSVNQFALARESALEGLAYARAARLAMGLDPGPDLPPLASAQGAGQLTREREVNVQGQHYKAGPQPGAGHAVLLPGRPGAGTSGAVRLVFAAGLAHRPGRRSRCARRHADLRCAVLAGLRRHGLRRRFPGRLPGRGRRLRRRRRRGRRATSGGDFGGGDFGGGDF